MKLKAWKRWAGFGSEWIIPGFLSLFVVVWCLGPQIHFAKFYPLLSWADRFALCLFFLLLWLCFREFVYYQDQKRRIKSLSELLAYHRTDSIYTVGASFEEHYDYLLKNKFRVAPGVYWGDLPWVLVVGPPRSGKSQYLSQWGLKNFWGKPLQEQSVETADVKCWFSQDAILIEIQDVATPRVDAFLKFIEKNKKTHLIQAIVLMISVENLCDAGFHESGDVEQARPDLIQPLADFFKKTDAVVPQRIPVYCMLTKAEQIPGFSHFFSDLTLEEQESVLGVSFSKPLDRISSQLGALFSEPMDTLLEKLRMKQIECLLKETGREPFESILNFPLQLKSLTPLLSLFLFECLKNALDLGVKGIFVVSVLENRPPYFMADFFKKVLQPEVSAQRLALKKKQRVQPFQRSVMVACLMTGLMSYWFYSGRVTLEHFSEYQSKVKQALDAKKNHEALGQLSERDWIQFFVHLRSGVLILQPEKMTGVFLNPWGAKTERALRTHALGIYRDQLMHGLFPKLLKKIENMLALGRNPKTLYGVLKFYLMLHNERKRDSEWMIHWVVNNLNIDFERSVEFKRDCLKVFDDLLQVAPQFPLKTADIDTARTVLNQYPIENYAYLSILEQVAVQYTEGFHFALHLDPDVVSEFENLDQNNKLDGFYTDLGYTRFFIPLLEREVKDLAQGNWVLGNGQTVDQKALKSKLLLQYCSDYTQAWWRFLSLITWRADLEGSKLALQFEWLGREWVNTVGSIVKMMQQQVQVPCVEEQFRSWMLVAQYQPALEAMQKHFAQLGVELKEEVPLGQRTLSPQKKERILSRIRLIQDQLVVLPPPMNLWWVQPMEAFYDKIQAL